MKISRSVEQGVYVLLMLALQPPHTALKSQAISTRLAVSDSYLKKILRRLVVAGLINSSAQKDGGFTLAQPIDAITLYDVCAAVDHGAELALPDLHLAARIFPGRPTHIKAAEAVAKDAFAAARDAWAHELKAVPLSALLEGTKDIQHIDWNQN